MSFTFLNDMLDKLNETFNGQIPNIIYFLFGIFLGFILFGIIFLIIYLVYKSKNKIIKDTTKTPLKINEDYKIVINNKIDYYNNFYKDATLKERCVGLGKLTLEMLEEISSLYYPESEDPMFEISIEQLVDFLEYVVSRVNFTLDRLLQERLHIVDVFTKHSLKDKKLSFVFEILEKKKNNENIEIKPEKKKNGFFSKIKSKIIKTGEKIAIKYGGGILNDEINSLLDELGNDINKLYSNQELVFTDLSKKAKKEFKKAARMHKKVGDNNA